jgi:N-acetylmuramoyl-L-alanine amidase
MPIHTVVQGEHVARIAQKYGFVDFNLIWNDPQNAELKKKRGNPHVLNPGDRLFVPEKQLKTENVATAASHTFRVKAPKLMLRLVVRDFDNEPVANTACELEIDGAKYGLKTDAQGRIQQAIPATAEGGVLRVPDLELEAPVKIGYLDPADEDTGSRQRLINLGYHAKALDDTDERALRQAIEEFQCDHGLKVTGQLDAATIAALKDKHGC